MKIQVSLGSFFGMLAAAAPLSARDSISDAYNGMSDIVAGDASCAPVAVIFARGTFDSGYVYSLLPHSPSKKDQLTT